jgi:hypothetical protein
MAGPPRRPPYKVTGDRKVPGQATSSPPVAGSPDQAPASFEPVPDVFASWRAFTSALGTHFPLRMSSAQKIGRAMHGAVKR